MSIVFTDIAISLDGYAAGPNQSADEPFGERGRRAAAPLDVRGRRDHNAERDRDHGRRARSSWAATCSAPGAASGTSSGRAGGATTRRTTRRSSSSPTTSASRVEMEGGTTFHFVTDGIESALAQAREAAGDRDVAIAGGATTVNQYLAAGLHRRAAAARGAAAARRGRAAVRGHRRDHSSSRSA